MNKTWDIVVPADFECTSNEYRINGKNYARVTQTLSSISKPGLVAWFLKVGHARANKIKETRQNLGTRVHKLFEDILKGKKVDTSTCNTEIKDDVWLFNIFKDECKLQPEALEQHLWSNNYGYAGTADYIGYYTPDAKYIVRGHSRFKGKSYVLLDWKTSTSIHDEYWLQLAAYLQAFEELTGIRLDGAAVVQFRNGQVKIKERTYDELQALFKVYISNLIIYHWQHNNMDEVNAVFNKLKKL